MADLFASDLHLDADRPAILRLFLDFLYGPAREAASLTLLGDLFEAWVGDDEDSELAETVCSALRDYSATGIPLRVMRGNRDFLLGPGFAARTGATLLPDPCVLLVQGQPTLLMHGDLLCSDDRVYQDFRRQVRDPAWQSRFLEQPLAARRAFAAQARSASRAHQQQSMESIMDVSPQSVVETLARFGVNRLIHGHTHRPAIHSLVVDNGLASRIVLGDWYEQGSVLRADPDGFVLSTLAC
jgi:UDP-2,3-diacylglucosamine hydrolase